MADETFLTYVINLANINAAPLIYTCKPEEAVIAAYAQARKDWSTWEYQKRYGSLVMRGEVSVSCGDFSALYRCPFCREELRHAYLRANGRTCGCFNCIKKIEKRDERRAARAKRNAK